MSIPTCVLTHKGAALQAKTPAGAQIPVTRWQIGTGPLPAGEKLEDMTQLIQPLMYLPITSVTNSGRQCRVLGQFVNKDMGAFTWEELGLWAKDPEEGEILYAVGNARGGGEPIEAWADKVREFVFGMELVFSGTANVTAEISRTLVFATLKDLEASIATHDTDSDAHPAITARTRMLEMALHGSETLTGEGAPTSETEGRVDQHYIDLTTGEEYVCTGAEDGAYTWEPVKETEGMSLSQMIQDVLQEMQGAPKFELNSYVGTGLSGIGNPTELVFGFEPRAVAIFDSAGRIFKMSRNDQDWFTIGSTDVLTADYQINVFLTPGIWHQGQYVYAKKSDDGKIIYFYDVGDDKYYDIASAQYNGRNVKYYYMGIG